MSAFNPSAVNLNLLVALVALVEQRSVTRAAGQVGVSQSAMSSSLAQLRTLFGDPLFRRSSHGIEPTPRALSAAAEVRAGLASFARALVPPTFDPAVDTRRFVILTNDLVELVLVPPLLRRLAREAPNVRLELVPWGLHEVPEALERGAGDLMVGFYDTVPAGHRHALLFDDVFTCIVRQEHPKVQRRLTLRTWLELHHVVVSQNPHSPGVVDLVLAKQGRQRTVGARVSHFLLAPIVVARTDMVAAVSERVADVFASPLGLRRFAPPVVLPTGHVGQVWHAQMDADPGHVWLRTVIADEASRL